MVGSALFGLVRATDPVPAYRLSAGSALPDRPTLAARWRPLLDPVLAAADELGGGPALGLVRRARAGARRGDGECAGERPDGSRSVVSHFNKAHKGRLARALAVTRAEPSDAAGVAAVARRAGMRVERRGANASGRDRHGLSGTPASGLADRAAAFCSRSGHIPTARSARCTVR